MAGVATLRKPKAEPRPVGEVPVGRLGPKLRRNLSAHGFLIGAVLCFTFFSWYPIVREVIMSFQKAVYGGDYAWAGWTNYIRIFRDPTFWLAWRNTLEFTVLALIVGYAVPFFVALLLNELRNARGYLRFLVYLPVMLPPASALLLFAYFYNPQYGLFVESFVLTNGGGGVGNNTLSVVMLIYQYAFALSGASNYNSASALGVMLMLVLAVFSFGFLWATRERVSRA
jgi:ABC-type sugar transport system permease subunit